MVVPQVTGVVVAELLHKTGARAVQAEGLNSLLRRDFHPAVFQKKSRKCGIFALASDRFSPINRNPAGIIAAEREARMANRKIAADKPAAKRVPDRVDNALWAQRLEQELAERTAALAAFNASLEQRNAERTGHQPQVLPGDGGRYHR